MIKCINILKRVGRFSELQHAAGADHEFVEFNVLFASNGAGKSTLCDVFRSMTLDDTTYIEGRKRLDAVNDLEIAVSVESASAPQTVRFQNSASEVYSCA